MYSKFICPDFHECSIEECLKECRMKEVLSAGRCLSSRSLMALAEQRTWNGTPSTTQLLRGTREAYLTITKDYPVDPQDMIFALFGTRVHAKLEQYAPEGTSSEDRLYDEISSGAYDFYDHGVLVDNKTYGSYAVAKTLGLTETLVEDGVYKSSRAGKYQKGDKKFKKVYVEGGIHKRFDLMVQLNDYRMKLEKHGMPVTKMLCEIIVRDGGTFIAQSRGVTQRALLVVINKISDIWISRYMCRKAELLHKALASNILPPVCKPRERWYDKKTCRSGKCARFCAVRYHCDFGRREMALAGFSEKESSGEQ